MHHYPFHPGDYMLDTAHLEPMEDLAYRRLLDLYYTSEAPIPLETDPVSRRLRLGSDVVSKVLNEFFVCTEEGWKHRRCDAEIASYQDKVSRAQENGKLGGRPKKTDPLISRNRKKSGSKANQNQELEPELEPKKENGKESFRLRIGSWFNRRPSTEWSAKELKALASLPETSDEEMEALEQRYLSTDRDTAKYRRQEILTLLNNWGGEVIRAIRDHKSKKQEDDRLF